jgi:hypothetical protein
MTIHPSPYTEYVNPPAIMGLLDSVVFFWLVVILTMGIFAFIAWKLWGLHSIPKQLAKQRGWKQAQLVFWLCMLGLIWKPLWVAAVVLVVIDWEALADWIRALRPADRSPAVSDAPDPLATPADAP